MLFLYSFYLLIAIISKLKQYCALFSCLAIKFDVLQIQNLKILKMYMLLTIILELYRKFINIYKLLKNI